MISEISGVIGPIFGNVIPRPSACGGLRPASGTPAVAVPVRLRSMGAAAMTGGFTVVDVDVAVALASPPAVEVTAAADLAEGGDDACVGAGVVAPAADARAVADALVCCRSSCEFCCCSALIFCSSELIRSSYKTRIAWILS